MCDVQRTLANQQEITSKATLRYCYVLFLGMLLVFISACRHNPVDSGNRFLAKPGLFFLFPTTAERISSTT